MKKTYDEGELVGELETNFYGDPMQGRMTSKGNVYFEDGKFVISEQWLDGRVEATTIKGLIKAVKKEMPNGTDANFEYENVTETDLQALVSRRDELEEQIEKELGELPNAGGECHCGHGDGTVTMIHYGDFDELFTYCLSCGGALV